MSSLKVITITTVILLAAGSAGAQKASKPAATEKVEATPVHYDFKGARLGMSFAQWQALQPPVAPDSYVSRYDGPLRAWCSNMTGSDGKPVPGTGYLTDVEKSLGVIVCRYGRLSTIGSFSSINPAAIKIGRFSASEAEYKFMDGKLFQIEITGHKSLLGEVLDGLTAKFGPATSEVNDTTQNKAGATFPHTEKIWANPVALIKVEAPYTRIDNLNVLYSDSAALKKIGAVDKALHPDADKM